MDKKLYLIRGGAYSDQWIEGYFEDRETAEKYCIVKNRTEKWENLWVDEIEPQNADVDTSSVKVLVEYRIVYFEKKNWARSEEVDQEWYEGERRKTKVEQWPNWVQIKVTAKTEAQAIKIADDEFNKLKVSLAH